MTDPSPPPTPLLDSSAPLSYHQPLTKSCPGVGDASFSKIAECTGVFNPRERASRIQEHRGKPEEDIVIRVVLGDEDEEDGCTDQMHSFFVCFGFSDVEPFAMPGTPVHFYPSGTTAHGGCNEERIRPIHMGVIESMCVAAGKRKKEFAVMISFGGPVSPRHVSALFDHAFNVTEVETIEEACASLHNIIRHSGWRLSGDMDPRIRCHEKMIDLGIEKWSSEMKKMESASEDALEREGRRGMFEYVKALACVDGLRARGVNLNRRMDQAPHRNETKRSSHCLSEENTGTGGGEGVGGFIPASQLDASRRKRRCTDSKFFECNSTMQEIKEVSETVEKRRTMEICNAHSKYMVGLLGCMSENPVGIRHYIAMYEDFMRVEGGAEIAL